MPQPRLPAVHQALIGVTSPKDADAGAVGLVPPDTDVADATSAVRAMSAALADVGSASDAPMTDEEEGEPSDPE
jgi:hypothetical protein